MAASKFAAWLITGAVGPAVVALPVGLAAGELAGLADRWFKRFTHTDDLSRLVRAASGTSVDLSTAEFNATRRLLQNHDTWEQIGKGTVEELAARITSACLPPRTGRTEEESQEAGRIIARGLLEFAVADLDPKLSTSYCWPASTGCRPTRRARSTRLCSAYTPISRTDSRRAPRDAARSWCISRR